MIDCTFDIANEYLIKLKLSTKEILELDSIYRKEDADRMVQMAKSDQDLLDSNIPQSIPKLDDDSELAGTTIPFPPIESYEEYISNQPAVIRKIHKVSSKYCLDKRLCYSNDHYYQLVFIIALHNLIEKTLCNGISSYELAARIVEQHKDLINANNFEKFRNTIYPKVLLDEFEIEVLKLNKDLPWHKDEECGLYDTFVVAFHHGQEIDDQYIQAKRSRLEDFIRGKSFWKFYRIYSIVPYLIQEIIILFLGLPLIGNPEALIELVNKPRQWIEDNYVRYISFMMFIATIFWMWMLKLVIG